MTTGNALVDWVIFAMVVSAIAQAKGEDGLMWFIFSLLTGPFALLGLLFYNDSVKRYFGHDKITK